MTENIDAPRDKLTMNNLPLFYNFNLCCIYGNFSNLVCAVRSLCFSLLTEVFTCLMLHISHFNIGSVFIAKTLVGKLSTEALLKSRLSQGVRLKYAIMISLV